jgi:hypothetical protein
MATSAKQTDRFVKFFKEAPLDTNQVKKMSSSRKKQLDEAFMKMIALDYQPLTLGERNGMRHFVNCAVPGYMPPCYATVKDSLLPAAIREVEEKLASALHGNNNFTIATDIWTNRRGHPFIAFIATYIDRNMQGNTVLLDCFHMPGHHTGDNIRDVFDMCLSKWKINDKISRVVTDNASNMLKAFNIPGFTVDYEVHFSTESTAGPSHLDGVPLARPSTSGDLANSEMASTENQSSELELTCENIEDDEEEHSDEDLELAIQSAFFTSALHLSCPIHTLQLAIKDTFDECVDVASLVSKVSKLVNSIRRSTLNTTFTDALGVRPAVSCVTRWNSQLKMIESVLKLFDRDEDFISKLNVPESAKLTTTELRSLTCIVHALQPLAELTETWQAEFGTLGAVLPSLAEVNSLMSAVRGPLAIRVFAETLGKNFEQRFNKYYSDVHLINASVLDPRFKTEWIMRDRNVREKIMAIRDLVSHNAKVAAESYTESDQIGGSETSNPESHTQQRATATSSAASSTKKPRLMFASYASDQATPSTNIIMQTAADELNDYLSSPRLQPNADFNVLSYWKMNQGKYPQLAQLARATYGIPSGSASAERVFSAGGLITRVHRLSMQPKTLEKLIFLKVNSALLL